MTTSAVQKQIAQWSPSVLLLSISMWLFSELPGFYREFLDFRGEVLIGLAELRTQGQQQTRDIADLRQRSTSYVTQTQLEALKREMKDHIELQLLKKDKAK